MKTTNLANDLIYNSTKTEKLECTVTTVKILVKDLETLKRYKIPVSKLFRRYIEELLKQYETPQDLQKLSDELNK